MYAIIRSQKLHTVQAIGGLESHLKRQYLEDNVDPERSHLNTHQLHREESGSIVEGLKQRLTELNITPRKNAVLAIEYIVTASPEFFERAAAGAKEFRFSRGDVVKDNYTDRERYFRDSLEFVLARHGAGNILSSTIHLDESNPHMHVVVLPIDPKGKLNARHFLGGRDKMRKLQDDYHGHITRNGLFKDLERGKRKERGAVEEYIQRTSPQIGDLRRFLSEVKSGIENEENALYERLQQLEDARKELAEKEAHLNAELVRTRLAATLHKPELKSQVKPHSQQKPAAPDVITQELPTLVPASTQTVTFSEPTQKPEKQNKKVLKRGRRI